uniref:BHLH domain-containing protein n=1 Tax=Aegilops tauschii subsp. strangulata TaxID=200361 RepID=A0A453PGX3_AEGTS
NGGGTAGGAGDGAASSAAGLGQHVLPGGVGTFSIRQLPDAQPREEAGTGREPSVSVSHGSRMEIAHEARSGIMVHSAPPTPTMWQDSSTDNKRSRGSRAEGRSSGSSADQDPSSPRSKHSATEQRRRTKINDRGLTYSETSCRTVIRRGIKLLSFWRSLNTYGSCKRNAKNMSQAFLNRTTSMPTACHGTKCTTDHVGGTHRTSVKSKEEAYQLPQRT